MTYAFLVVVSVAITLKLMFLFFSLFVTFKTSAEAEAQAGNVQKKANVMSIWKQTFSRFFTKSACMEANNKTFSMKL